MIGRGAYGKPWLISQVAHFLKTGEKLPDPSIKDQLVIVLNHYDEVLCLKHHHSRNHFNLFCCLQKPSQVVLVLSCDRNSML